MTPNSVFARVVTRNSNLAKRFRRLSLETRHVLLEIFKLVADSPERGVFRPDPEDGPDPLPQLIAEAMNAFGYEETIREALAILARLDFLVITADFCIVIDLRTGRASKSKLTEVERSMINSANGSKGGRPKGSRTNQQGSLMLPIDGHRGPIPYGSVEDGETLARQMRAELAVAPAPQPETEITKTETELASSETEIGTELDLGLVSGGLPGARGEEEEDSTIKSLKQKVISESSSSSARVDAPEETKKTETETETGNQNAKTENRNSDQRQGPGTAITPAAIALADRFKNRWGGCERERDLKMARRCFEDRLQEGWKVSQIEGAIDSDRTVEHPGLYKKVLQQLFGVPGQSAPAETLPSTPPPRVDTRNYPPDLAGEWTENLARIRSRIQKLIGDTDYRSWFGDKVRFTAFDDGELTIWSPTAFVRDYVRGTFETNLFRIISTICPRVKRLVFVSSAPLAQTG